MTRLSHKQSEETLAPWRDYFNRLAVHMNTPVKHHRRVTATYHPENVSGLSPENPSFSFTLSAKGHSERYIVIAQGAQIQIYGTVQHDHHDLDDDVQARSMLKTKWRSSYAAFKNLRQRVQGLRGIGQTALGRGMNSYEGPAIPRP